jgi:hypothetical protein
MRLPPFNFYNRLLLFTKPSKNASEHFVFVRIFSYLFIAMLRIAFVSFVAYFIIMLFYPYFL